MAIRADVAMVGADEKAFQSTETHPVIILNDYKIWDCGDEMRFGTNAGVKASASFYIDTGDKGDIHFNGHVIGNTDTNAFQGDLTGDVYGRVTNITTKPDGTNHSTAELDEDPNATVSTRTMYYTDQRVFDAISVTNTHSTDSKLTKTNGVINLNHFTTTARTAANNFGSATDSSKDGEVIQDISITNEGHVSNISTANLDDRYHPVGGDSNTSLVVDDLTVNGTTTTVNSQEVSIGDTIITLADNRSTTHNPTNWTGITINRGAEADAHFHFDETANKWRLYLGVGPADTSRTVATLIANIEGTVTDISNHTTDSLIEGTTNKYYTNTRARASISAVTNTSGTRRGSLSYNSTTGVISYEGVTQAEIRKDFSAGSSTSGDFGSLTYTSSTGKFTYDKVSKANVRSCVSVTGNLGYNKTTGVFNYDEHVMSHGLTTSGRTVKVKSGTGVAVNATGVHIGQAVGTNQDVTFNSVTAGSFNTTSDMSLKNNIQSINTPLQKIQALDGVGFNWNSCDTGKRFGMIADDVEQVIPEAVAKNEQGLRSIDYSAVVAHLVEAVKDLSDKVDSLSNQ